MTTEEMKKLWRDVRENNRKLSACKRHRFDPIPIETFLGAKHTCLVCGGTIDNPGLGQYVAGYEAAGGHCDDIYPGYRATKPKESVAS